MDEFIFKQLTNKGFSSQQINQITFIIEKIGFSKLMDLIDTNTDVEVLRNLNKFLKDKDKYSFSCFESIFELVKKNISFGEIFEINVEKAEFACELLKYEDFDREKLKYLKCDNITIGFLDDYFIDDLKNNVADIELYYRDSFNVHELYKARALVADGMPELVDKIIELKKIGITFNDMVYFKKAEKVNIDLINLLDKTKYTDIARRIVDIKLEGIDLTGYLDKIKSYSDTTLYLHAAKNDLSTEQIDELISYGIKNVDYDALDKYMFMYKEGIDVQPFITNNCREYFLGLVYELVDNMDIVLLADREDYVVILIKSLFEYGREDLVDIVLNLEDPDEDAFSYIEDIIERDYIDGTRHKIINLFYDKGADLFGDYEYCYEFDYEQKSILSYCMAEGKIDDETIDLLRDNSIDADKMEVLANIIEDGNDISILVNNIGNLSVRDLEAAQVCLDAGFDLVLKERNIEK